MMGLDKGIAGTMIGGSVLVAIVYIGLKYAGGFGKVGTGAAKAFGNYAKVAQGV